MATNRRYSGYRLPVTVSSPTTPASGGPVRWGTLTGVAVVDEGDGGNAAGQTTVDFGPGVWEMVVSGVNTGGGSAVAEGDALYFTDGAAFLDKRVNGTLFGYALSTVSCASSGEINVMKAMP